MTYMITTIFQLFANNSERCTVIVQEETPHVFQNEALGLRILQKSDNFAK